MKTKITLLTSAVFACIITVEGQAATFTNTIPVQLLNSTYYYELWQKADLNDKVISSTETAKKSATTHQPFSESLTLQQSTFYSEATGNAFSLSVYSKSTPQLDEFGTWLGGGLAFTTGTWQFQATTNDKFSYLLYEHTPWATEFIVLTDLTTNQEIYNVEDTDNMKNFITNNFADQWKRVVETDLSNSFGSPFVMDEAIISGHIYQLEMGVLSVSRGDSWTNGFSTNLTAVPLPLPIWLFATGLIFLGKWRSRT